MQIAVEVSEQIAKASNPDKKSGGGDGIKGMMARRKAARKSSQQAQISDDEALNLLGGLTKA